MNKSDPQDKASANRQGSDNARPPLRGVSTGLFEEDVATLNALSATLDVSRSVLVRSVIRDFLEQVNAGRVELAAAADGELEVRWKKVESRKKTVQKKGRKKGKKAKKARGKKKSSKGKK